jgi:D-cysteine desulfhydrase
MYFEKPAQKTLWDRPLKNCFPNLIAKSMPWCLARLPTPIIRLKKLGNKLGHKHLYLKQDGDSSPAYGGNKVRKLEFLFAHVKPSKTRRLLTMGGNGSNHVLATAVFGSQLGFEVQAVVFPQPHHRGVERNREDHDALNTKFTRVRSKYLLPLGVVGATLRSLLSGHPISLIPAGGSSPWGNLGYVNAGLELAEQLDDNSLPEPKFIFIPFGTGGTAAGLALGLRLAGLSSQVMAVRVADRLVANPIHLKRLISKTRSLLGRYDHNKSSLANPIFPKILHHQFGKGYSIETPQAHQAMTLFRELEDISLDPTYTGKAAAAFIQAAQNTDQPLLFWNTFSSIRATPSQVPPFS